MSTDDKKETVSRLSDYTNNALQVSPEQAIEDLQKFLRENPDFNKVFLIAIDTRDNNFLWNWWKGRMLSSEAITALHQCLGDLDRALRDEEV